jgi:hypothetical protein
MHVITAVTKTNIQQQLITSNKYYKLIVILSVLWNNVKPVATVLLNVLICNYALCVFFTDYRDRLQVCDAVGYPEDRGSQPIRTVGSVQAKPHIRQRS